MGRIFVGGTQTSAFRLALPWKGRGEYRKKNLM